MPLARYLTVAMPHTGMHSYQQSLPVVDQGGADKIMYRFKILQTVILTDQVAQLRRVHTIFSLNLGIKPLKL